MADIRCPMCGKPNPDDRDTCQYCQARLKPLIGGPPEEQPQAPSTPPAGAPEPEAPAGAGDWLSDFRTDEPEDTLSEEGDASGGSSDSGDWFSRLEGEATDEATSISSSSQLNEDSLPDWLRGSTETPASEGEAEPEDEPDWLHQFHEQSADDAVPGPGKSYQDTGSIGATDWLSGLSSLGEPSAEEAGQADENADGELPDWMKPAAEPGSSQPAEPSLDEALPDWSQTSEQGTLPSPESPSQEVALPDWMHELGGEPEAGESGESASEESAESAVLGDLPDWLSSQMPPTPREETPSLFGEAGPEQEIDWSQAEAATELPSGVPDWLTEASAPTEASHADLDETPSEPAEEDTSADWFSKLGVTPEENTAETTPAFVMSDEDMVPFVSGDEIAASEPVSGDLDSLPDWLSQVSAEPQPTPPETPASHSAPPAEPAPQPGDDLAPAQLPTWLEAMRPVESAAPSVPTPEEGPSTVETAGPLAGLRGILPAEAEIARIRKPPVYSVKLQISEAHQARVSLLEELIASEGQPKPVAPHAVIVPQTALRLAVALLLILAVLGAFWMGNAWTTLPDPASVPPELESLRGQIEALSGETPVLVAFDYDPGFSGEMEAAASAVIAHLMEKRVPLVFVSTNPLGPALAERLVKHQVDELNSQLLPNTTPYTTSLFTNLGYIPGGIAGLRAFAETPAQIFPRSLNGQEIWDTPPLTSSATLAGFALALVIADNPDTARSWIEQAAPVLKPSPLLMIVSAQAEPIIRPYYDSGQVQGMLSGLAGGAAYENKTGLKDGLASASWDAFSASLLVATILILIGGLVNASLATMARNKRKGEEQPYA